MENKNEFNEELEYNPYFKSYLSSHNQAKINYGALKNTPKVYVTKEFTFDSCHRLYFYNGKCNKLHGHTYKLQVTLAGVPHADNGMVYDFNKLKEFVQSIVKKFDHEFINEQIPYTPTAEIMSIFIWDNLTLKLLDLNCKLYSVKLWETPTSFVEYKGEFECYE